MEGLLGHFLGEIRECLYVQSVQTSLSSPLTRPRTSHDALWFLSLLPFVSFLALLVQCYRGRLNGARKLQASSPRNLERAYFVRDLAQYHGDWTILAFLVGRAVGCTMLFITVSCLELRRYWGLMTGEFVFGPVPYYVRPVPSRLMVTETFASVLLHGFVYHLGLQHTIPANFQSPLLHAALQFSPRECLS